LGDVYVFHKDEPTKAQIKLQNVGFFMKLTVKTDGFTIYSLQEVPVGKKPNQMKLKMVIDKFSTSIAGKPADSSIKDCGTKSVSCSDAVTHYKNKIISFPRDDIFNTAC